MVSRKLHILKGRVIIGVRVGNGNSSSRIRDISLIPLGDLAVERAGKHWWRGVILRTLHDVVVGIASLRSIAAVTDATPRIKSCILIDKNCTSCPLSWFTITYIAMSPGPS